jgi:protein required for attachment to host cells
MIRIVVADRTLAVFYDADTLRSALRESARLVDPSGNKQERELVTDRPGRRVGYGTGRHGVEEGSRARTEVAARFARRIGRRLDVARRAGEFDELIVVAGPTFLGLLRERMSGPTRERVVHEVGKDLVHATVGDLRRHIPTRRGELGRARS